MELEEGYLLCKIIHMLIRNKLQTDCRELKDTFDQLSRWLLKAVTALKYYFRLQRLEKL